LSLIFGFCVKIKSKKISRTEGTVVTEDVFSGLIKPALFKAVHEKRIYQNINKTCRSANDVPNTWGVVSARRLRTLQSVPTVRVFLWLGHGAGR
jgi:hypothetical protein